VPDEQVIFGFREFWPKVYDAYKQGLDAIVVDSRSAGAMFNAAQTKMLQRFETLELAVYLLVSMTAGGLQEMLILRFAFWRMQKEKKRDKA
jgi:hypothetical protein